MPHDKPRHIMAYLTLSSAVCLGGGSLVLFIAFLYAGPLNIVDLGLKNIEALGLNALLCLAFFVQHSCMIRRSFRQKLAHHIPIPYHGAVYALISGITLLLVIIFWHEVQHPIMSLEAPFNWVARLSFFLSFGGLIWGARSLRSFDSLGRRRIMAHLHSTNIPSMPFSIRGPYRYVRHPFYFFILIMIWSFPEITLDRLLFNSLWSLWIVVGTVLEERDLSLEFGQDYTAYQKKVPMLIPWRIGLWLP